MCQILPDVRFWQRLRTVFFSISVAMTLLFPPAILADNAKLELASGSLHLPLVEVVLLNGEVVCYQADLGLISDSSPMTFSLSNAAPVDCGNEQPQACQNPGTPSYNECQTRRLQGTWSFTYTDGNTTTTRIYVLTEVQENLTSPSGYVLVGTNEVGKLVAVMYHPDEEVFSLTDIISSTGTDARVFMFDFVSEDTVAGCLYLLTGENLSDCYDMTGTSTSGRNGAAKRVPIDDAVQGIYEKSKHLWIDKMK
jgi:hypothetical protein